MAGARAERGEQGQMAHSLRGIIRRLSLFLREGSVGGYRGRACCRLVDVLGSLPWLLCRMVGTGAGVEVGSQLGRRCCSLPGRWRGDGPRGRADREDKRGRGLLGLWCELCGLEGPFRELGTPGGGGWGRAREELGAGGCLRLELQGERSGLETKL